MTEDEWVKAAMHDDSVVVELLLGLNHLSKSKPSFPLDWSVRQRRSKPPVTARPKKAATSTRDSPTTPLSWSAGTSVSCGGGGAVDGSPEESSYPNPPSLSKASVKARSKLNETKEKGTTKRSRKKKTLAELKEDEIVLLRERRLLKKELATLRVNLEKQRATNENLKRIKLDLQPQPYATTDNFSAEQERLEIGFELPDLNLPLDMDI